MRNRWVACTPVPQMNVRLFVCCFVACALAWAGCGKTEEAGATAKGIVLLDGKPIDRGVVIFNPVGEGTSASGQIREDGTFEINTSGSVTGLKPGQYKVAIVAWKVQAGEELPDGTEAEESIPLVPEVYHNSETSGLTAEVTAEGPNEFRFELKSNAKAAPRSDEDE